METRTNLEPSAGAMAWRGTDFGDAARYSVDLSPQDRDEIADALRRLAQSGRLAPAHALSAQDFGFGALAGKLRQAFDEVRSGRGFVLLRGLPVDGRSLDEFVAAVWGIGLHFGHALSQNAQGELIGHVVDASREDPTPRMFRSNLELRLHTDWTAMLSLACWQPSQSGGASIITSALTVHDEIARRAPHLLEMLYRGFHYHRLGEEGPGEEPVTPYRIPVFCQRNGQLSCRYQRAGIAAGHRDLGVALGATEIEALNLFDEVARAPENRLAFHLDRGDMLVVNNFTMMHARTAFTEYPEPERRRHLIRLWPDAEGFRDVPREFMLFAKHGVPPQPGRQCSYDFKKLYGDDPVASGGMPEIKLDRTEASRSA